MTDHKQRASDTYLFDASVSTPNTSLRDGAPGNAQLSVKWEVNWLPGLYAEKTFPLGLPASAGHDIEAYEAVAAFFFAAGRVTGRAEAQTATDPPPSIHMCPPRCDAGGPANQGGHDFSIPFDDYGCGGAKCSKCGLRNIDFDLMRLP